MGRRKNTKSSKLVVIIVLAIIYLVASLLDKDEQKVREIERNALVNITENLQVHFIDQTTPNMIQGLKGIFARKPLISRGI